MFKEIETAKGVLKYRDPDLLEAHDLLIASGVANGESSTIMLKRNIIASLDKFLDYSGVEGAVDYQSLLNDIENMAMPLSEIADDIILKTFSVFKKKSS